MALLTRPRSQVSPRTVWTVALNLLALVAVLHFVTEVGRVISWILVALFLALAVQPLVAWLEERGVRRGGAVLLVFLLGGVLTATFVTTFVPMVVAQVQALVVAAPDLVEQLRNQRWVEQLNERFDIVDRLSDMLRRELPQAAMPLLGMVTDLLLKVAAFITVVVLAAFFLLFGRDLFDRALLWVRPGEREHWRLLARRMHRSVGGFMAGVFLIALIAGVVTTVTMLLLGVPFFLPLGLAVMLLSIIPFLGAWLAGALVVLTTLASVGTSKALIALAVFFAYQQAENHLLQPLIQRRTLRMNPLLIALVMLVGTAYAGILGALLALPIAGAVQVLAQDALARRQAGWRRMVPGEERPPPGQPLLQPPAAQERPDARH